jgi:hypothetical protein
MLHATCDGGGLDSLTNWRDRRARIMIVAYSTTLSSIRSVIVAAVVGALNCHRHRHNCNRRRHNRSRHTTIIIVVVVVPEPKSLVLAPLVLYQGPTAIPLNASWTVLDYSHFSSPHSHGVRVYVAPRFGLSTYYIYI